MDLWFVLRGVSAGVVAMLIYLFICYKLPMPPFNTEYARAVYRSERNSPELISWPLLLALCVGGVLQMIGEDLLSGMVQCVLYMAGAIITWLIFKALNKPRPPRQRRRSWLKRRVMQTDPMVG